MYHYEIFVNDLGQNAISRIEGNGREKNHAQIMILFSFYQDIKN